MLELIAAVIMNGITSLVKKIPAFNTLPDGWHKTVVRTVVVALAYVSTAAVAWVGGEQIDLSPVEQALPTALMFLQSQGLYFLFTKFKKVSQ